MSSLPIVASSVSLSPSNSFKASFDERQWVINIRRTIEDELEDDTDIPAVSIFCVPKTILATKPESYIPQHVALGPYHYLRSELYDTERYKLVAAKKIQKQLQTLKLQNVVDLLIKLEPRIRSYYDKYLNFNGETLAWMMMVDASFLLEFLQIYAVKEGKILPKVPSNMSQVVDYSGMKAVHNAILRDALLLENQIPLFVLKLIIESQYESIELGQDILNSMLIGLCKDVSPFKLKENSCSIEESMECAHLLDFIYSMIVPKSEQLQPGEIEFMEHGQEGTGEKEEGSFVESSHVKQLFGWLWAKLGKLNRGPIPYVKKILVAKPLKLVGKLPWKIITRVPGISLLAGPLGKIFSGDKEDAKPEEGSSLPSEHKPPLIEEITIPSVTELASSGVLFLPTNHDISNINFDVKTFKFYLPTINLDVHTEIVLRNLVAYEASKGSGPMVITRYTELMNGIIDTEEDAKLLREKGIVSNHLKSDVEVADLWNGMSQSVKLTKVKFLDNVIEEVNKFYSNRWKVKFKKLMKVYIFGSWQILTLLAAVFVLFLMTLQSFCSVYTCSRIFGIKTSELTGLTND